MAFETEMPLQKLQNFMPPVRLGRETQTPKAARSQLRHLKCQCNHEDAEMGTERGLCQGVNQPWRIVLTPGRWLAGVTDAQGSKVNEPRQLYLNQFCK